MWAILFNWKFQNICFELTLSNFVKTNTACWWPVTLFIFVIFIKRIFNCPLTMDGPGLYKVLQNNHPSLSSLYWIISKICFFLLYSIDIKNWNAGCWVSNQTAIWLKLFLLDKVYQKALILALKIRFNDTDHHKLVVCLLCVWASTAFEVI